MAGISAKHSGLDTPDLSNVGDDNWWNEQRETHEPSSTKLSGKVSGGLTKFADKIQTFADDMKGLSIRAGEKIQGFTSVEHDTDKDFADTNMNPEVNWSANMHRNNDLFPEEVTFLQRRKERIASSGILNRLLGLPASEQIHPDDVPVLVIGGSGGGARAMLSYFALLEVFQQEGLWDLVMYIAGVSGSCWTLGALYTVYSEKGINLAHSAAAALDHFAWTSYRHPLSLSAFLSVLTSPHGPDFLFGPLYAKHKIGIVPQPLDLYGSAVTCYQFLPAKEEVPLHGKRALDRKWFKFSHVWEKTGMKDGSVPMPILVAVRHERPWKDWSSPTDAFQSDNHTSKEHAQAKDAWWQSFEFTPLATGCSELFGWVPTWAFGRKFSQGITTNPGAPEQSFSQIMGLCTSAPAGPLSAYLQTIVRNLPKGPFGSGITNLAKEISEKYPQETDIFENHHPIHASNEPNPFFQCPKVEGIGNGFENSPRVHLIDAGMHNNLPLDPWIRPHRPCDIQIQLDASSDVQTGAALERINQWAQDKGCEFVPRVKLQPLDPWPTEKDKDGKEKRIQLNAEQIAKRFEGRYIQVFDGKLKEQQGVKEINGLRVNERNQPLMEKECVMLYMPLLPNKIHPDYDPSTAPFSSSYNLTWTAEQVQTIRTTGGANVKDSLDGIKAILKEVYEKKKRERLAGEGTR